MSIETRLRKLEIAQPAGAADVFGIWADYDGGERETVKVRRGMVELPSCTPDEFERLYPSGTLVHVTYADNHRLTDWGGKVYRDVSPNDWDAPNAE